MSDLENLFVNNRAWVEQMTRENPDFFHQLSGLQSPEYLWIGCSDSRVPANEIVNLLPGELFVHRNVANIVLHTDFNCLSVIQYAVYVLKVKHIIVCGHYGCGGVKAALEGQKLGLIVNWIHSIRELYLRNRQQVDNIKDETQRLNRLCELNVIQQVSSVCHTTIVQKAWEQGQELTVHGWIYGLDNGILEDMKVSCSGMADLENIFPDD